MERDDDLEDREPGAEGEPSELDREQLQGLRALRVDVPPPAGAEAAVLRALRGRGMLPRVRQQAWRGPLSWPLAASVALMLAAGAFAGGVAVGRLASPGTSVPPEVPPAVPPAAAVAAPRFLLLLYEDAGFQRAAPALQAQRAHEYGEWARGLGHGARFVDGEELADRGRLLEPDGAARPWQAAWVPAPGVVAGFFLVEAADLGAAEVVARGCPHLAHGGRIEVRPIATRSGAG